MGSVGHQIETAAGAFLAKAGGVLLAPTSPISLVSLLIALVVGVVVILARRPARKRDVPLKVLMRALFPRRMLWSPSTRVDLAYTVYGIFVHGLIVAGAILSYRVVGLHVHETMNGLLGPMTPSALHPMAAGALLTLTLFLAYELAFWVDHYTSHTIPFFWEIHKVHHTATSLTPLTLFRVHPIESLKLSNIMAVVMGAAYGVGRYLLGGPAEPLEIAHHNVILFGLMLFATHLQHTQLWIAFTGVWGRLFVSPAHHQIHHSDNPADFGKNLGGYLAIFDWAFGTLRVPTQKRQRLTFGVAPHEASDHSLAGVSLQPVLRAFGTLAGPARAPEPAARELAEP